MLAMLSGTAPAIPEDWRRALSEELRQPYFARLAGFVASERRLGTVYPPEEEMFSALRLSPLARVKVLILGQDPYHGAGQAHGLAFSVRPGIRPPPSLKNIFRELKDDLGCRIPNNGDLAPWAAQGVLLLNAVLTVREGRPNSHKDKGWERFTDAVIRAVAEKERPVVFMLWGAYARKKARLLDPRRPRGPICPEDGGKRNSARRHVILGCAHPSPLSAFNGFFGSRPFSAANAALLKAGERPIDWQLPDI